MTILMNTRLAAGIAASYVSTVMSPVTNILLCVGNMPTDAQIDALTSTSNALIANNTAITFGSLSVAKMKAKNQTVGPILVSNSELPLPYKVNSTKAGTIGWAVIQYNTVAFSIVDVGLPNSGAAVQIDTLDAVIGQPITFLSLSYKLWR